MCTALNYQKKTSRSLIGWGDVTVDKWGKTTKQLVWKNHSPPIESIIARPLEIFWYKHPTHNSSPIYAGIYFLAEFQEISFNGPSEHWKLETKIPLFPIFPHRWKKKIRPRQKYCQAFLCQTLWGGRGQINWNIQGHEIQNLMRVWTQKLKSYFDIYMAFQLSHNV